MKHLRNLVMGLTNAAISFLFGLLGHDNPAQIPSGLLPTPNVPQNTMNTNTVTQPKPIVSSAPKEDIMSSLPETQSSPVSSSVDTAPSKFDNEDFISSLKQQLIMHEGVRDRVYMDTTGHPTIGIGLNLDRPDAKELLESVGANYEDVKQGKEKLTPEQMDSLLTVTANQAIEQAKAVVPIWNKLDSVRQKVLADMAFVLGGAGLSKFKTMLSAISAGDFLHAAQALRASKFFRQTGNRGRVLARMLETGKEDEG